jgi:hypothetical protein
MIELLSSFWGLTELIPVFMDISENSENDEHKKASLEIIQIIKSRTLA